MKRSLAETYVEMTDIEWDTKFLLSAMERQDFLETEKDDLLCDELVGESDDQYDDAFLWFLGLPFDQQQRVAQRLKEGLERVRALRESNRKRAEQLLARGQCK